MFLKKQALIFVGATGIAVRAIAPFLKGKHEDPAVIVIDESGKFVISLLSGHIGGANKLTEEISGMLTAMPIITTATDARGIFSVDSFAVKNGFYIDDLSIAKKISAKLLDEQEVFIQSDFDLINVPKELKNETDGNLGISISIYDKKPFFDTLLLVPRLLTLGIGCKRGKSFLELENFFIETLKSEGISRFAISNVSSIDIKKDEPCLIELCEKYKWKFDVYNEEELNFVSGEFTGSEFVKRTVGVDSVCERSCILGSNNGELLLKKRAKNGMTIAIAIDKEKWSVDFEK